MMISVPNMFLTVALNYQKPKSHPERISRIKPFIDQYN